MYGFSGPEHMILKVVSFQQQQKKPQKLNLGQFRMTPASCSCSPHFREAWTGKNSGGEGEIGSFDKVPYQRPTYWSISSDCCPHGHRTRKSVCSLHVAAYNYITLNPICLDKHTLDAGQDGGRPCLWNTRSGLTKLSSPPVPSPSLLSPTPFSFPSFFFSRARSF